MRRGRVTAAGMPAAGVTKRDLARLMVGRDLFGLYERTPHAAGRRAPRGDATSRPRTTAACRRCAASRSRSAPARSSGSPRSPATARRELAEVITGLRAVPRHDPDRRRDGQQPAARATRSGRGVAHVPEDRDRRRQRPEPVDRRQPDHEALSASRRSSRGWLIDDGRTRTLAEALKEDYEIAAPSVDTQARLLSGGNLQRLILAREIETKPTFMVAVQPTRGLDVGAIETVHRLLLEQRERGCRPSC